MSAAPALSVLHVAQSAEYGLGRYLQRLVCAQAARGWEVTVAGDPARTDPGVVESAGAGWRPWVATRSPGPGLLDEVRRLGALVEEAGPQVVHLHSSKAGLAGRALLRGRRPTIFQPHAWSFYPLGGALRPAAVRWERLGARWCDVVVCGSRAEMEVGRTAGIRARWRVVPNSVDVDAFPPAPPEAQAEIRRRLGLDQAPLAVCAGRLTRQKGQDVLLRAWPAVEAEVPAAVLVLVGDGEDRAALESQASAGVRFAGRQEDVAPWLAAADVVVQPSRYETLSLSVLEAMATGRSVVATDVTGMREVLGDDAGAVVPPDDPGALADAMVTRLRDPARAQREGQAGRSRVIRAYNARDWEERMVEVTMEVAGR